MLNISEEVLAALVNNKVDPKEIVSRLAVHRPEVLLQMLHIDDLPFQIQAVYSTKPGEKNVVAAIKKYRALAGTGLKEAKLAVEKMVEIGDIRVLPKAEETYAD